MQVRYDNVFALSFRKSFSSSSDEVTELAEDVALELNNKKFNETLTSSVQDQAVKKVAQELNFATNTCDA